MPSAPGSPLAVTASLHEARCRASAGHDVVLVVSPASSEAVAAQLAGIGPGRVHLLVADTSGLGVAAGLAEPGPEVAVVGAAEPRPAVREVAEPGPEVAAVERAAGELAAELGAVRPGGAGCEGKPRGN